MNFVSFVTNITLTGNKTYLIVNLLNTISRKMRTICAHLCKKYDNVVVILLCAEQNQGKYLTCPGLSGKMILKNDSPPWV